MTDEQPRVLVPAGTVLELAPGTWCAGEGFLRLRVQRVMTELPRRGDAVWLAGTRLDTDGRPDGYIQVLVRVDALPG